MGRRWISPAGNLYVSLCLEKIPPAQAGIYSFLAAVALMQAIEKGTLQKCEVSYRVHLSL